jgi:hypothetical protein
LIPGERNSGKLHILENAIGCRIPQPVHEKLRNAIIIVKHSETARVKIFHEDREIREFSKSKDATWSTTSNEEYIKHIMDKCIDDGIQLLQDYWIEISKCFPMYMVSNLI